MSDVHIRPAGRGDIAAITHIYAEAVLQGTATFEIDPPTEAEMARRRHALCASNFPYFVAEQSGVIAGYAYAGPHHSRPGYRFTVEDAIYVAPRFHRRGVGRRLLDRVIAEAEVRGFRQMIALIGDSANAASIALHKASGFRSIGTIQSVGFKHGRWVDIVTMQRALNAGAASGPDRDGLRLGGG